jgi:hypothetical protein
MTPIKFYIGLIVAVIFGVAIALFGADYRRLQQASAQNENRGQVLQNASDGIKDGEEIDTVQQAYTRGLADARAAFQQQKSEAKRNEPETAMRAVRPVPDSVRDAARQRRLARERLGCAGRECEEGR